MPGSIRLALVVVWLQAAANGFGGFLLLDYVNDRLDHGQEVENQSLVEALAYASILVAGVLAVCAVLASWRFDWVRVSILVIQAMSVASALVALVSGGAPTMVLGIVLAAVVSRELVSERARAWFNR